MRAGTQWYRSITLLIIYSLVLLSSGIFQPTMPSLYAASDEQPELAVGSEEVKAIANEQTEFVGGKFRRTALTSRLSPDDSPYFADQPGGIQLMPIGALTDFSVVNGRLPTKLSEMGVVTMGNYIIIIGGSERIDKDSGFPDEVPSDKVWVGEVDGTTGLPPVKNAWVSALSLPPIQASNFGDLVNGMDDPVGPVVFPAVVGVPDSDNSEQGYVYVIGGFVRPDELGENISSAGVHIGRLENGTISSWQTGPTLRHPDDSSRTFGIHSATATYATVGDTTYVYVLGGFQSYLEEIDRNGSRYIFYAKVGTNGKLLSPVTNEEGWEVMRQSDSTSPILIPVPEGATGAESLGLWLSSSVQYQGTDPDGNELDPSLYLIGGQRRKLGQQEDPNSFSNIIFRAKIESDGRLTWNGTANLPQSPLSSMESAQFNGNLYIAGGKTHEQDAGSKSWSSDGSYQDVLSSFFDETMQIDDFASNDMKRHRFDHGLSIVRKTTQITSSLAFFYVLAGRSDTSPTDPDDEYSNFGTDTILFSRIDPDEATPVYSLKGGWYYSNVFDISQYNNAETKKTGVLGVNWSAAVSRTETIVSDIKLEYRVDDLACDNGLVFAGEKAKQWRPLSTTLELSTTERLYMSDPGGNKADFLAEDVDGELQCFQYRAYLSTKHVNYTPVLLNVGLRVITDKEPDLYVDQMIPRQADGSDTFIGLDITIRNLFENEVDKTADANFDGNFPVNFYTDLYIFSPGQPYFTEDNPPEMPFIEGVSTPLTATHHHFYATIPREQMAANTTFPPSSDDQSPWDGKWKYAEGENINDPVDMQEIMSGLDDTGTYTACVVVDSYLEKEADRVDWPNGYVKEGREDNNWKCVPIEVEEIPVKVCVMKDMQGNAKEFDADEQRTINGTYTISRTVDTGADLPVYFDISGTSSVTASVETEQPDYNFGSSPSVTLNGTQGSVTIPEGSLSVTINFVPVDDKLQEGDETMKVTIVEVGSPPSYQAQAIPDTNCRVSSEILIEDNDWYVYLPTVSRE